MRYVIVQPASAEAVQSGICHMPYWVFVALLRSGETDVELWENETLPEWRGRTLDPKALYLLDFSCYTQLDLVRQMYLDALALRVPVAFIGYQPAIDAYHFPYWRGIDSLDIPRAVFATPLYHTRFKYTASLDCDTHVVVDNPRPMLPVFLSVGCKRACMFCYVSVSNYPFGCAYPGEIEALLDHVIAHNLWVHFYDEDFMLHPQLDSILQRLHGSGVRWICLATSVSLAKAVEKYGAEYLIECGLMLVEIGLEVSDCEKIGKAQALDKVIASGVPILWLVMTFLPHDTPRQHNLMGAFLRAHGIPRGGLLPRLSSNSTEAGLGQFFQAYHGTKGYTDMTGGKHFTFASMRLWPSWVGDAFLDAPVRWSRDVTDEERQWYTLYMDVEVGRRCEARLKIACDRGEPLSRPIREVVEEFGAVGAIIAAQLSRLGVLEAV